MSDSAGAPKLFISYRRDETPVSAAWLYEVLVERFGESNVFMDLTLKPGEDFVERITDVLGSCHILLLVMGPRWATPNDGNGPASIKDPDDFVRLEAEVAMARPDVEVLPVLVGGAKMPHRDELPEKIQGLTRIQAKELTNQRRAADMAELVARIEELLPPETMVRVPDRAPPGPSDPPDGRSEPERPAQPRRRLVAAAAAMVVVVVAVVLALAGGRGDQSDESEDSGRLGAASDAEYPVGREVSELDARENVIVLTTGKGDGFEVLAKLDRDGQIVDLVGKPANYNGLDVGTNARGVSTVVVSRCDSVLCDVNVLQGDRLAKRRLSTTTCRAARPSMFDGKVLFSRDGEDCQEKALLLTDRGGKRPKPIAADSLGADLNGSFGAALEDHRTVAVFEVSDPGSKRRFNAAGRHSFNPPVTVDGEHVYFVGVEGSSYSIVRINYAADQPELERYVREERALPEASAPSFGVTSDVLYVEGRDRVIFRDDDPEFETVDGAIAQQ